MPSELMTLEERLGRIMAYLDKWGFNASALKANLLTVLRDDFHAVQSETEERIIERLKAVHEDESCVEGVCCVGDAIAAIREAK